MQNSPARYPQRHGTVMHSALDGTLRGHTAPVSSPLPTVAARAPNCANRTATYQARHTTVVHVRRTAWSFSLAMCVAPAHEPYAQNGCRMRVLVHACSHTAHRPKLGLGRRQSSTKPKRHLRRCCRASRCCMDARVLASPRARHVKRFGHSPTDNANRSPMHAVLPSRYSTVCCGTLFTRQSRPARCCT